MNFKVYVNTFLYLQTWSLGWPLTPTLSPEGREGRKRQRTVEPGFAP